MADAFDWDKDAKDASAFDWDALDAALPQEVAPPAKALPMSTLGATLKAMGEMPNQRLGGLTPWLMGKLGVTAQPMQRVGAPEVGGGETYLNKAANMVPLGGVATDLGTAGSLLLGKKAGKVAPDISRAFSGLTGRLLPEALQIGPVPGPGAVLTPEAEKELAALGVDTKEPEAGAVDTYRRLRDVRRTRTEAGEEQNPVAALLGSGTGLGLSMLAPLPKFTPKGGADAGVLARIAAGAKTGGAYGGIAGLTSGDADTAGGEFTNTALQGAFGLGFGSLLGGAAPAAGALGSRLLRGVVKPTPAAQALQKEGVEGLTLGQMDPKSPLGNFERAVVSKPVVGPMIAGQREVAEESFRVAALNKVRPPGMKELPQGTTVPDAMAALQSGFNKAYRAVDDMPAPTLAADRMLTRIAQPNVRATANATEAAIKDAEQQIANQMTLLPAGGTQTTVGLLRTIRGNLREAIRSRAGGTKDDQAAAKLLREAEQELTDGISGALPEKVATLLKKADAQYGKYKVLEDAAFKAGDTEAGMNVFTPARITSALKAAARQRGSVPDFTRGGGGPLRDLSASGAQALAEAKPTGWGASMAGGLLGYGAAPFVYLANRPGVQPFMLGQAPSQRAIQSTIADVAPLLSRFNPPQTFLPQALAEALRSTKENP